MLEIDGELLEKNGKIIHQIWFGTMPNKREAKKAYKKLILYRDSWIEKNPTWHRHEWNKKECIEFVNSFYPEYKELLNGYRYEIQRCDVLRYLILHRYGGWYADMDYYCNKSVDEALYIYTNDIYFVQSPNSVIGQESDHVSNSLMYSKAGHFFWKKLMLELENNKNPPYYYSKHLAVMFTTGPGILNRVYNRYKYQYKLKSLPYKLFHPYGINDAKLSLKMSPDVFAIHVGKGSWEGKDSKFFLFVARHWKIIIFIIIFMSIPLFTKRMMNL